MMILIDTRISKKLLGAILPQYLKRQRRCLLYIRCLFNADGLAFSTQDYHLTILGIIMKKLRHALITFFCLSLMTLGQAYAEVGHDAHQGNGPAKLSLDHGKKWQTDEPLRKGMEALRSAFAEHLHAIHGGKLSVAEYKGLGEKTEKVVGSIVAECKLEPEADAMLHLVIADMIAGADMMMGKAKGKPRAGAHKVVSALNNYGRYFDHPKWNDLK